MKGHCPSKASWIIMLERWKQHNQWKGQAKLGPSYQPLLRDSSIQFSKWEYFIMHGHYLKFKFVSINEGSLEHRQAHSFIYWGSVPNIIYFRVTLVELSNVAHKSLKYLLSGPLWIKSANLCPWGQGQSPCHPIIQSF